MRLPLSLPPLLRDTPFRRYWTGRTLSEFGGQVRALALPLTAVLVLHAGPTAMSLVAAAGSMPSLLASLHVGAWVDRRGRRRELMLLADLGRASLVAAVPALWALGLLRIPVLIALALGLGTLGVVFRVAAGTLFVSLVPKERYVEANALLSQGRAAAFLLGPGAAGYLIAVLSAPLALCADALAFLASAVSLARVHPTEPPADSAGGREARAGLRTIWRSDALRPLWLSQSTIALSRSLFFALYVLYLTRVLLVTPAELGIILGPSSAGALLAASLARTVDRRLGLGRSLALGTALTTMPILAVPLLTAAHPLVVALLFVIEGTAAAGVMITDVAIGTIQAAAIPDAVRSRVLGAFSTTAIGLTPIGALLAGSLAAVLGLHATMWIGAVGSSLGLVWLFPDFVRRVRSADELAAEAEAQANALA